MGGRFCCLAYHSGEDRIVKRALTQAATDTAPDRMPVVPDHLLAQFRLVATEKPTTEEIQENPRAASARLRAIERVREAA
ncbi:MAG: 16S rRNA (cytosine(1402)-N(4))-methyltransferase [Propionibacterium sp.]|nr:MAG: 16S rRNA (cytosine(1402)-N(4))-methyltransferase [Propionibacterium sp.]